MQRLNKDLFYYISDFLDDVSLLKLSLSCQKAYSIYNESFYKYRFYKIFNKYIDSDVIINSVDEKWKNFYFKTKRYLQSDDYTEVFNFVIMQDRDDLLSLLINKNGYIPIIENSRNPVLSYTLYGKSVQYKSIKCLKYITKFLKKHRSADYFTSD